MINWNEIKDKYPKAWNLLIQFQTNGLFPFYDVYDRIELQIEIDEEIDVNDRSLYDFFDQNELWIEISAQAINDWSFDIFRLTDDNFDCLFSESNYKLINRSKAEEAAFYKAFELLEHKI
jgi:hypothetical protein